LLLCYFNSKLVFFGGEGVRNAWQFTSNVATKSCSCILSLNSRPTCGFDRGRFTPVESHVRKFVTSELQYQLQIQVCVYSWQRGTARIRSPLLLSAGRAAIDPYLLPAGPTAANLQQRVCCCRPMLQRYRVHSSDRHHTVS